MKNTPKKKKKKNRYVEPGSSRGFLTLVFLGLVGYGSYAYKPWQDDWELVRALFGQGRHHSLVGEWEVVKTIAVNKAQGMVARDNVQKGSVKFSSKGKVTMDLVHPESETTATGQYQVDGTLVAMRDLEATGDSADPIPHSLVMNLAWTGNDNVIAMDKTEAIYLHRRKTNSPLKSFMQLGLKKEATPTSDSAPPAMRGVIGDMKRSMQDNDESADNN